MEPNNKLARVSRPVDYLTARPLIAAALREGMAEGLDRSYRVRSVDFDASPGVVGLANRAVLEHLTLHYCRYEVRTAISFPRMDGYRQFFSLGGQGRVTENAFAMDTGPELSGIAPPSSRFDAIYQAGYSHLVLQVDATTLLRKGELLRGGEGRAGLRLPVFETLEASRVWRIRALALGLAAQFDAGYEANPILVAELEQALITAFIVENGVLGDASSHLVGVGNSDLRRLEDYIHAHWDQPLTISAVAEACGVGIRSLFNHFKREHGVTPLAYLRQVRLERAREMLISPVDFSVLDIALRCGFASFGHFARRYRERFGELPSETRRRERARAGR